MSWNEIASKPTFQHINRFQMCCFRQERSMAVLEHMITALNTLTHAVATDARQQLCRLGETLAIPLLYLWHNRPSVLLKVLYQLLYMELI